MADEESMTRRAMGWVLLLGSPGVVAGISLTVAHLPPIRGLVDPAIAYCGIGPAILGSAVGAHLLTARVGKAAKELTALAAAAAAAVVYTVTVVAARSL